MAKLLLAAASLAVASPAVAAPVTLDCTRPTRDGKEMQHWQFTLDEQNSTAVIAFPSVPGSAVGQQMKRARAAFTADKGIFEGWTVSRTDLTFRNAYGSGQCKIVEVVNRAF